MVAPEFYSSLITELTCVWRTYIVVDDANHSKVVRVSIKQSKTGPFRKGVDVFLGRMGTHI